MTLALSDMRLVKRVMSSTHDLTELFREGLYDALSDLSLYESNKGNYTPNSTPFSNIAALPPRIREMGPGAVARLPFVEYGIVTTIRVGDSDSAPLFWDRTPIRSSTLVASGAVDGVHYTGQVVTDYDAQFLDGAVPVGTTQWVDNITEGTSSFIKTVLRNSEFIAVDPIFLTEGDQYEIYETEVKVTYPIHLETTIAYSINAVTSMDAEAIKDRCLQYFWPKANRDLELGKKQSDEWAFEPLAHVSNVSGVRTTDFNRGQSERVFARDFTVTARIAAEVQTITPALGGLTYTYEDTKPEVVIPTVDTVDIGQNEDAEKVGAI